MAELLGDVTTWTGGGPGMMEAASLGAKEAGKVVGGIRIAREAGTSVKSTKSESAVVVVTKECRWGTRVPRSTFATRTFVTPGGLVACRLGVTYVATRPGSATLSDPRSWSRRE